MPRPPTPAVAWRSNQTESLRGHLREDQPKSLASDPLAVVLAEVGVDDEQVEPSQMRIGIVARGAQPVTTFVRLKIGLILKKTELGSR